MKINVFVIGIILVVCLFLFMRIRSPKGSLVFVNKKALKYRYLQFLLKYLNSEQTTVEAHANYIISDIDDDEVTNRNAYLIIVSETSRQIKSKCNLSISPILQQTTNRNLYYPIDVSLGMVQEDYDKKDVFCVVEDIFNQNSLRFGYKISKILFGL